MTIQTNGQTTKTPATTTQRPAYPATGLREAINRLFDEFSLAPTRRWPVFPQMFEEMGTLFTPRVDVKETEKEIVVSAEIPGMDGKDIDVNLVGDSLLIKGEKRAEKEAKAAGYHRVERTYGSFERMIELPCEVQCDKVEAVYKDGVLNVTLPKTAKAAENSKKIEVKAQK